MARLSVFASALPRGALRLVVPVAKDASLRGNASSIAAGVPDESLEKLRAPREILPVLLGSRAEVDDVCA